MSNNDERQERIAQIRARVEAATPGPWATWPDGTEESVEAVAVGRFVCHLNSNMRQFREDAALIANAPADLAYLLSELDAATARAERVESRASMLRAKLEQAWIRDAGYQSAIVVGDDGTVSIAAENWPFVRRLLAQYGQDSAALAEGA